jgi:hypothetical protein
MRSDEYLRLYAACRTMANQANLPDVQARWRTLAESCLSLANDELPNSRAMKHSERQSTRKPIPTGPHLAIAWYMARSGSQLA